MTDLVALPKPRFTSRETASIVPHFVGAWQDQVRGMPLVAQAKKLEATAHMRGA